MPFFSWQQLHKKYPKYKNLKLQVILAPRNCGKSYATYYEKIIKAGLLKPNKKVLFMRNTDKELISMKADFNNRFKDKYIARGNSIYEALQSTMIDKKTGREIETIKTGSLVGYFASINGYTNFKSTEAKDIKLIFYEEFNEDTAFGVNLYFKFINLLKTFERFNDVQLIMLGNKDSYKTDFHVNWDIMPEDSSNHDIITEITTPDGGEVVGVWYDLSPKNFEDLNNCNTLSDKLAKFDSRTSVYSEGGYRDPVSEIVINFRRIITDFIPKFNVSVGDVTYCLGQIDSDTSYWAILSPWNYKNKNLKNYALDVNSRLVRDALLIDEDDVQDLGEFLFNLMKNQKLIFDSYETHENFRLNTYFMKMAQL